MVFAYPGNMSHAQQAALAVHEAGYLDAFVTSFVWRGNGALARCLRSLPGAVPARINHEMARRSITDIPPTLIHSFPVWEIARSAAIKVGFGAVAADLVWDRASFAFDKFVARRFVPSTGAIIAFEYTALAAFRRAKELGIACVLHMPSLDSRHFEEIQRREKDRWPELVGPNDAYFLSKFERRYARRLEELALADVVIANSSLTRRSHIEAGIDPAKIFAVPLGAPPAIDEPDGFCLSPSRPLTVIWAGAFSLRKGGHHMLEAWRLLKSRNAAKLHVYGNRALPSRFSALNTEGIAFHGSVSQPRLFEAFRSADVLVFPTLSDGFGMVVAEAFAHGLPVITTDQAGAADLVTAANGIIVPPANPGALADALRWCLDNRSQLAAMRWPALRAAKRRQWSHYRSEMRAALATGLKQAGHSPGFGLDACAPLPSSPC